MVSARARRLKKDGRRLELGERGPGLGCRNADLLGELDGILVRVVVECRCDPVGDVDCALPAAATHRAVGHRRLKLRPVYGAAVDDDLRLAAFVHRRRAPLPRRPGRFAAAGSGDKSTFAGV
jgi:hypothetical protein